MKQIVYEIVVFLHLMGYNNTKTKLLTQMYENELEIVNEALIEILKSIVEDMTKRNFHESIIRNIENYIELIHEESQY